MLEFRLIESTIVNKYQLSLGFKIETLNVKLREPVRMKDKPSFLKEEGFELSLKEVQTLENEIRENKHS